MSLDTMGKKNLATKLFITYVIYLCVIVIKPHLNPTLMPNIPFFVYSSHLPEGLDAHNCLGFSNERQKDGYRILLGLLPELPGSLPQHLAWVHFPSLKDLVTFLPSQNHIDFKATKSPRHAERRDQSTTPIRRASIQKKVAKGGSIFEIMDVYGGNIKAYLRAKLAEENAARAVLTQEIPTERQTVLSSAQAMASSIPYAAFRSTNLLPRLVAIAKGQEFLAVQKNARVNEYPSADAYIVSMQSIFAPNLNPKESKEAKRTVSKQKSNPQKTKLKTTDTHLTTPKSQNAGGVNQNTEITNRWAASKGNKVIEKTCTPTNKEDCQTYYESLTTRQKRIIAKKTLNWCKSHLGTRLAEVDFIVKKAGVTAKLNQEQGHFKFRCNQIVIYSDMCQSISSLISVVIHEYTHFLQPMEDYNRLHHVFGYEEHPFEVEARENEKLWPSCYKEILAL